MLTIPFFSLAPPPTRGWTRRPRPARRAAAGLSLPVIGALLGHSQPGTTARYAHLSTDPLRAASDIISGRIAAAMRGKPADGGNVVALKPKAG